MKSHQVVIEKKIKDLEAKNMIYPKVNMLE